MCALDWGDCTATFLRSLFHKKAKKTERFALEGVLLKISLLGSALGNKRALLFFPIFFFILLKSCILILRY